jgi:protein SCO1/2
MTRVSALAWGALAWMAVALAGCNRASAPSKDSSEPLRQYPMQGAVVRLDAQDHIATIKSGKIQGWMEAMTMDFPVKDQADFAKLHAGDQIRATVYVQGLQYWVGNVQPEGAAPPPK